MSFPDRRPVLLILLAVAAAVGAAESPEFSKSVQVVPALEKARKRASAMPSPEAAPVPAPGDDADHESLWVSVGREDISTPAETGFPLGVPVLSSARAAVYRVPESRLPELSDYMHQKRRKCGGFFAHSSRAEAEEDLQAPRPSAAGDYTIDQQAAVRPLVARVDAGEIVKTIDALAAFQNRYYAADTGVGAASAIASRWGELAQKLPGSSVESYPHSGWKQPSVILTIPGTDRPQEIVVMGGHLDSISGFRGSPSARAPGADDNASGIAVLTETIRILGEGGFRPSRTLKFMGYAAEEVGLRGSKEIAADFARRGAKVRGVIQFDMTAFKGSASDIWLISDYTDATQNAFLGRLIDEYVKVSWSSSKCGYACSDHASWNRSGFPASLPFESSADERNQSIHTANDTLATAGGNGEHAAKFAKLAVAYAVESAKAAAREPAAVKAAPTPSAPGR